MKSYKLTFIAALFLVCHSSQSVLKKINSCDLDTSYKFMSSKTDYGIIGNANNFNDYKMPQCKQIGLWHLNRHGGRYPDQEDIVDMNKVTADLKQKILKKNSWFCDKDLKAMSKWNTQMEPDFGHILTTHGRQMMKDLGIRMNMRLGDDMISTLKESQVRVQVTNLIRTHQSAEEYMNGLLDFTLFRPDLEVNQDEDYLLKYPDYCKKYLETVGQNSSSCLELKKFETESTELKLYKQDFANKLGLNLSGKELNKVFELTLKMCQYEYLIEGKDSIWCKLFDKETLKIMEYKEDIRYNCKYGYKHEISKSMTCDLVINLLDNLKTFKRGFETSNENEKKIQLLFSHSSTMLSFFHALGIGKDDKNFNFNNIFEENQNRKYKLSVMDPMNSNVAFILYKCSSSNQYAIRAFHNENLIKLEACRTVDCHFDEFISHFEKFTSQCSSSRKVCRVSPVKPSSSAFKTDFNYFYLAVCLIAVFLI